MHLPKLSFCALAFLGATQSLIAAPSSSSSADTSTLNKCTNLNTTFSQGLGSWKEVTNATAGWSITRNGLEMILNPPQQFVRLTNHSDSDLPYNEYQSPNSPSFGTGHLLHYGKVTFTLKTAGTAGAVTAAIFMAPGGDEIDFEMLGGDLEHVQTNFFYGEDIVYNVNSANTPTTDTAADFHAYTIDWSPDRIQWSIDGKVFRTTTQASTCDSKGVCAYPTHPSAVQFGLWDASSPSGTAQWARGPIDWKTGEQITAYVKSVSIECNPQYNQVV